MSIISKGNASVSYFLGDRQRENPQTILSGDRNITNSVGSTPPRSMVAVGPPPGRQIVIKADTKGQAPTTTLGYSGKVHQNAGNLLLGDGSVQQLTSGRLRDQVRDSPVHWWRRELDPPYRTGQSLVS